MTTRLTRREFLAAAAVAPASATLAAPDSFAFPLLGDLHFDRLEHHDMAWLEREKPNDVRQVQDYSRLTRERLPSLFSEVRGTVAESKSPVPFIIHVGDFVEGLCGTPELAKRHCREAVEFLRDAKLGAPFLMTKGNHDVTGPGAVEAFNEVLLPFQSGEARQELRSASYSFTHGNAMFAVFDAYTRASLDWLEKTLEARTARHLFVLIHPPVVPYNARSMWHVYSHANLQAQRERLLALLGRHRAIVLTGHLHKYGLVARKTKEGRFAQLAVSSIIPSADGPLRHVLAGAAEYGPDLVRMEPNFDPQGEAVRRESLRAEAPSIDHYDYADTAGYAVVRVEGGEVRADIYTGIGRRLWKTVDMGGLLG